MVSLSQSLKVLVSESLLPTVALHEPQPGTTQAGVWHLPKQGGQLQVACQQVTALQVCICKSNLSRSNCYKRHQQLLQATAVMHS